MKFEILSVTKEIFGTYSIRVIIANKRYTYRLTSQFAYDKSMKQYRLGQYGRCLALLDKYKEAI